MRTTATRGIAGLGVRERSVSFKAALLAAVFAGAGPAAALAQSAEGAGSGTTHELGPVVVTSTATEHTSLTSPSFTTVITGDEIEKLGPSNGLPDLLRKSVGVADSSDNLGRDEVVVRGLGANYTLVLVNGKRVSSSDALWRGGDFDYHSIPLAAIDRVEIVRGPMSALYGSDAIGGVVNIITKKPSDTWTGSIGGEYRFVESGEDGNQYRVNVYGAGPIGEKLSAVVSGEIYRRDAWSVDSKDNGDVPALEEKSLKNLFTSLTWDIAEDHALDVTYNLNRDERPYAIYDSRPSYRDQDITRHTVGAAYRANWGWGTTLLEGNYERGSIDDYNSTYNAPQQRSLVEKNLFLHGRTSFGIGFNTITTGAEYRSQTVEDAATFLVTGKSEIDQTALYLQDEIGLTDEFSVTLGGRLDHHEIFGNHFTGRATAVYALADWVSLKGGVSQGFKAPDAYQLSPEYSVISCGGRCFLSGNPDLEPETSTNYEIGAEFRKRSWDASIVFFKNKVKDMILPVYDPVTVSRNWANVDSVDIKGVEISGSVDITDDIYFSGNYAYLYTEDNNGDELENRPRHKLYGSLTWQFMEQVGATVAATYTGPQFEGSNKLTGYTTVDLGLTADVTDDLQLRAGVKNLTDVILTDKDPRFLSHELGRNYYVAATYRF